jgi:drug/metabolite transporter (DMT)-like permease
MSGLWIVFTVLAAGGQTLRNALQRELTKTLGTVGATHVRFLYGLPFGVLFLGIVLAVTGLPLPLLNQRALGWTALGAISQIGGTALLLSAMQTRSFVVATAYSKTEPVLVALFGLAFLGDQLTLWLAAAIVIGTLGVVVMSWPKAAVSGAAFTWQPVLYGIGSAALFGLAATGFRGGILALDSASFVVRASTILALGLSIQTVLLSAYLLIVEPQTLLALFRAWRQSVTAGFMGAFASQMWFLAFALETAAKVRTLALIEIFFAQWISRTLFKQSLASREGLGIAMIVIAVVALLWQ